MAVLVCLIVLFFVFVAIPSSSSSDDDDSWSAERYDYEMRENRKTTVYDNDGNETGYFYKD